MKSATPDNICPIAKASELVGDMWILLIVRELLTGSKRFNELQNALVSAESQKVINSRTLTQRLQTLEKSHIISRAEFNHEKPPRVEYTLTKEGKALSAIIDNIRDFGKKYL
jgi:DNA-binding HxlR family transcriptional regulator